VRSACGRGRTSGNSQRAARFRTECAACTVASDACLDRRGRDCGSKASRTANGTSQGPGSSTLPASGACPCRKTACSTSGRAKCQAGCRAHARAAAYDDAGGGHGYRKTRCDAFTCTRAAFCGDSATVEARSCGKCQACLTPTTICTSCSCDGATAGRHGGGAHSFCAAIRHSGGPRAVHRRHGCSDTQHSSPADSGAGSRRSATRAVGSSRGCAFADGSCFGCARTRSRSRRA
jgi:hypothetical protein